MRLILSWAPRLVACVAVLCGCSGSSGQRQAQSAVGVASAQLTQGSVGSLTPQEAQGRANLRRARGLGPNDNLHSETRVLLVQGNYEGESVQLWARSADLQVPTNYASLDWQEADLQLRVGEPAFFVSRHVKLSWRREESGSGTVMSIQGELPTVDERKLRAFRAEFYIADADIAPLQQPTAALDEPDAPPEPELQVVPDARRAAVPEGYRRDSAATWAMVIPGLVLFSACHLPFVVGSVYSAANGDGTPYWIPLAGPFLLGHGQDDAAQMALIGGAFSVCQAGGLALTAAGVARRKVAWRKEPAAARVSVVPQVQPGYQGLAIGGSF